MFTATAPRFTSVSGTGSGPRYRSSGYGYGPVHYPRVYSGRGYSGYGWGPSVYRSVPAYNYFPGYGDAYPYYSYPSGSAASTGLLLGSLAGGVIGHNSGDFRHNGWRGAAWGAGIGWLLGSVVDSPAARPGVHPRSGRDGAGAGSSSGGATRGSGPAAASDDHQQLLQRADADEFSQRVVWALIAELVPRLPTAPQHIR
jgi:hypothetical protein